LLTSTIAIASYFVGLRYGAVGVATAVSIVYCGLTVGLPGFWYCFRGTPLRLRDAAAALWRPALTSLSAAGATYLVGRFIWLPQNILLSLIYQTAIYMTYYILAWMGLPNGREHLSTVLGVVKSFQRKREPMEAPERAFGTVPASTGETATV
jgi:hypothetical protein